MDIVTEQKKCRFHKEHGTAGFTLIEIMVALVIFAFGILGVAKMQISAINGNAAALKITEKFSLASNEIERLMGLPYTDSDLDRTQGTARTPASQPLSGYDLSWTVQENADDSTIPLDAKRIVVTVVPDSGETCILEQLIARLE
ncbi:prepilin-type N-terminal cleavage/methylation domain-containing protein [Desulfocicer vacuolatum DSM 3385]|uniref:Prepilin-type N-terminal cleavage/methylation domain-containing protein n=1 Tax=Desulfocicer vacuolatum DSM 3385 TaxID=1121400 RepID=A0A1W1ZGY2_9BACT|nr:prepilin-type N-terminal cleavage/methylation domain-containing protein [Desulfocicer vacuolatum]SMC47623.1 prepilin-type N-terminal cleavage/methylation domain-containing protein [Desulfocicer vacuolatum DSM 3385]